MLSSLYSYPTCYLSNHTNHIIIKFMVIVVQILVLIKQVDLCLYSYPIHILEFVPYLPHITHTIIPSYHHTKSYPYEHTYLTYYISTNLCNLTTKVHWWVLVVWDETRMNYHIFSKGREFESFLWQSDFLRFFQV